MDTDAAALKLHEEHSGKIATLSKVKVETAEDLSLAYTPGVAAVSKAIADNKNNVYKYTIKKNTVAIVSDGSAVLGFLSGYLVCSFVVLLIFITPLARHSALKGRKDSTPALVKSVSKTCGFIGVISLNCRKGIVDGIVNWLIAIEDEPQEQD